MKSILTWLAQRGSLPAKFIDCVFKHKADEVTWEHLANWLGAPAPLNLEFWSQDCWLSLNAYSLIRLRPTTWVVMLRRSGLSPLPYFQEFLADPLLHQRPTWCVFDRWWLHAEERAAVPRRSSRASVPTVKKAAMLEDQKDAREGGPVV